MGDGMGSEAASAQQVVCAQVGLEITRLLTGGGIRLEEARISWGEELEISLCLTPAATDL